MPLSAAKIIREILFVPPSMPAIDLLAKMQATRIHLALVIDEYGGTDGIVSIEDMVEQIVGDIEDEHDEDEAPVDRAPARRLVPRRRARHRWRTWSATVGPEFDVGEAADEVDTLAGYIMTRVGRLPSRGEVVPGPGEFEIEVLDADPRRLKTRAHHAPATAGARTAQCAPARRDAGQRAPAEPAATRRPARRSS